MPDAQLGPQISDLERERIRLQAEIQDQTERSKDPAVSGGQQELARQRLEKLNDDYRQLLMAMKPAASTINPNDIELSDGRVVRVQPDGTTTQVWPLNNAAPPPKATTPSQMGQVVGGRLYVPDPNDPTRWTPVSPQSPDDITKIAAIGERETNKALTGRYMTNDESLKYQADVNRLGYDAATAARAQSEFETKQRVADQDFKQKAALFPGALAQQGATTEDIRARTAATQASTTATGVSTARTQQEIEQAALEFPTKQAQSQATLAGTQLGNVRAQQQITQANAPAFQAPPTGMYNWQRDPNTGQLIRGDINPEWQAKTMPEVQARIGQIQNLMQAKGAEVQAKVDAKTLTPEQGLQEYNQWYAQNVQSQVGALQAAQEAAQFKQAQDLAATRTAAQTAATAAGTLGVNAFNAQRQANPVGPGFAAQMNKVASRSPYMKDVDFGAAVWQGPSPVELAQQQSLGALKYIDPTAAQAAGVPPPNLGAIDINQQLNRLPYAPGAGGPPAGGPPGGGMPAWLNGGAPPPPPPTPPAAPTPPMVSSGAVGPWAGGTTPPPGTLWQNPDFYGQYQIGG